MPPAAGDAATVKVTAGLTAPEGDADLAVQAQARVGNDDVRTSASVPVVVKPPFTVSVDGPLIPLAGKTATVTGKVKREAVFKEAVRLTVAGLPDGLALKAAKTVAANEEAFALEFTHGPKRAPFVAPVLLQASATIAGQNYAHRPVEVPVNGP
jgi:hypothetical protein